jgi:CHAP domain
VSLATAIARVGELNSLLPAPTAAPPAAAPAPQPATSFASKLQAASATVGAQRGAKTGEGIVKLARAEVGQREAPMGSNDSPRIAEYRSAVPGGPVGPWCAYFASWVSKQNGTPLGERGQGFARVDDVYAWAQRTGRAVPNGPGVVPKPGDLIIWDEHMGIVESVLPDGRVRTIEGNSSDQVSQRVHEAGSALGYVRMS